VTTDSSQFFYERIADRFEGLDHPADVRRRLHLVFGECLGSEDLSGKLALDAGCGYGLFSEAAAARGADVISLDIGERLVARTIARSRSRGVVADACRLAFRDESFDLVISSEMIEHTPEPSRAVRELGRVLRARGLLILTTPNRAWQGPVRAASRLGWRPFQGIENFLAWNHLEQSCAAGGLDVLLHRGFHPWPFQLGMLRSAEKAEQCFGEGWVARWMVNQVVVAKKRVR
jgi:2-polyprenyl-6-hydroxyphenyl methylase/3-demethylubiquinone-9 3-methyltransferase